MTMVVCIIRPPKKYNLYEKIFFSQLSNPVQKKNVDDFWFYYYTNTNYIEDKQRLMEVGSDVSKF